MTPDKPKRDRAYWTDYYARHGDEIRRRVEESRVAQGLPPTVEDVVVLDRIARIFLSAEKPRAAVDVQPRQPKVTAEEIVRNA